MDLKKTIRTIPDFPKPGIMFRDVTTLIKDYEAFNEAVEQMYNIVKDKKIDAVAGIESRGFVFGAPLALKLGVGFVLVRKKGKLPGETIKQEYIKEYGPDIIEIHKDAISQNQNVLLVDDLIATGGTMKAAVDLVEKMGGKVASILFVVDLPDLGGKELLKDYDVHTLVEFEGD
ncbi:adenine phosphoribosyltransferase [Candidatus Woesearchaeota archaeon]|nr:adenine phosphoribosyltransferase [Candidatus Woesearchaeota archaeon]